MKPHTTRNSIPVMEEGWLPKGDLRHNMRFVFVGDIIYTTLFFKKHQQPHPVWLKLPATKLSMLGRDWLQNSQPHSHLQKAIATLSEGNYC